MAQAGAVTQHNNNTVKIFVNMRKYICKCVLQEAGDSDKGELVVEISPLASYTGEGLGRLSGRTIEYPFTLDQELQTDNSNGV